LGRGPAKALDPADILPHHRVLPLPPVRFNHITGEKQTSDADMLAYTRRLFSPLRHEHLFDDFPAFLRQAAAVLEGRSAGAGGAKAEEPAPAADAEAPPVRRQGITPKRPSGGGAQAAK
jgi:hypothetical protein